MTEGRLDFFVRSSSGDQDYQVIAYRAGDVVRMTCQCDAAENGLHCKHRLGLLMGNADALSSDNGADLRKLIEWVKGTPLEAAMAEVSTLEKEAEAVKRRLSSSKKKLGRVLSMGR